jgi:3-dehydroquinate synthase class II
VIERTNLKSLLKLQETNGGQMLVEDRPLYKIIEDARQKNNSIHQILQNHFTIRLEKNSSQLHKINIKCLTEENAIDYAFKKFRSFQKLSTHALHLLKRRMWVSL